MPPLLSLTEGACTPLRPPYAADLRDEALIAANAQGKAFFQQVGFGGSTTQVHTSFFCFLPSFYMIISRHLRLATFVFDILIIILFP